MSFLRLHQVRLSVHTQKLCLLAQAAFSLGRNPQRSHSYACGFDLPAVLP